MSVRVCLDCGWPENDLIIRGAVKTFSYSPYWCRVAERSFHRYEGENTLKDDHNDLRDQRLWADPPPIPTSGFIQVDLPVAPDMVNHPPHYAELDPEPIDVIEKWGLPYHIGNVLKYISRAGRKDPSKTIEDFKKARWFLDRFIQKLENDGNA